MNWSALQISAIVVVCSTLVVGIIGLLFAFLLARTSFIGKEFLDALLTMPLVLPPTVTGYFLLVLLGKQGLIGAPIYELTGFSFVFSWQGAVIAAIVVSLPLMIRASRAGIEAIDSNFETVAYTLGKGRFETFLKVTLPLAKRGIIAGLILSFARALGEFGATIMIAGNIPGRTQTMPVAIYEAVASGNDRQAQMLALVLTLISIAAIYATNRLSRTSAYV